MTKKWASSALGGRGNLNNWHGKNKASTRRGKLRAAMRDVAGAGKPRHKSALKIFRRLLAVANVNRGKNKKVVRAAEADMNWIKKTNAWKRR